MWGVVWCVSGVWRVSVGMEGVWVGGVWVEDEKEGVENGME